MFLKKCTKRVAFYPKNAKKGADFLDFSLLNRLSLKLPFYFMKIGKSRQPKNTLLSTALKSTLHCIQIFDKHLYDCTQVKFCNYLRSQIRNFDCEPIHLVFELTQCLLVSGLSIACFHNAPFQAGNFLIYILNM